MKLKLPPPPEDWPESAQAAAAVVLLLGLTYVLRPRDVASFIRRILEEFEDAR
jgi:hypothetical protein